MAERAGERSRPEGEYEAVLARLDALEHAAAEIGTRLDERSICAELAGFLVRRVAEAAAVDLLPPEDGTPGPGTSGPGTSVRAGAVALLDRSDGDEAPEDGDAPDGLKAPAGRTTPNRLNGPRGLHGLDGTSGTSTPEAPNAPDAPGGPHGTAGPGAPGRGAVLTLPLLTRTGKEMGRIRVARAAGGFSAHDTAVVAHAARLAALHLGHARRLAATEATALHLQRALVAEPGRPHPNLEIAGRYLPAGPRTLVGGDWFETVRLHFGRSLLVVGDVMGHGLDAAVDMNAYRGALREVAATDLPPHRVLRHLDAVVADDEGRRPATCLLVQIDPGRLTATFASAGHLPPVVFGADGSAELVDLPVGPPLGTGLGGYEHAVRALTPADTLLLFTDGLVERRGEDIDHSLARLAALRLSPGSGPEAVVDEVLRRLDAHTAEDDVAVLAARVRERPVA
ncbi:SpoIIE family protein phosphatase [Streptomyces sp. NPDC006339]|uniref:PP2C family protein-serine/threonine phosphatase n=1 Tax=Streptomyces sp. NPDC006339 TaxID=3156755 RepID=UPI0033B2AE39